MHSKQADSPTNSPARPSRTTPTARHRPAGTGAAAAALWALVPPAALRAPRRRRRPVDTAPPPAVLWALVPP
ncbi:hypothetical protein ACH4SP_19505 [Streptomyces sp. NPDC021093]|uniref:hypothetical protein n=1 Tax=Streptomyces sp. NPDC021093 TaxID=3365112 RepID=UPI0037A96291